MSSDKETKIRVVIVLDVIGRPPKHLTESLERVIKEIDNEEGINVVSKDIKEAVPMKDRKDFYTTFAEIEVELEEIIYLAILMFKYMPAHIEVISPEIIALPNTSWNDILNELSRRLHGYDEIARMMQLENQMLKKKIMELTGQQVITPMTLKSEIHRTQEKHEKKKGKSPKKKIKRRAK